MMQSTSELTECRRPKTRRFWREHSKRTASWCPQTRILARSPQQEATHRSFIVFRETKLLTARDYLDLLLPVCRRFDAELVSGCVAVFRSGRLRVRKLPFSG